MNEIISQLIDEPYLIAIPILMAFGGYYGYLINTKKNETAIKINNSLFLIFTGLISIIGTTLGDLFYLIS